MLAATIDDRYDRTIGQTSSFDATSLVRVEFRRNSIRLFQAGNTVGYGAHLPSTGTVPLSNVVDSVH